MEPDLGVGFGVEPQDGKVGVEAVRATVAGAAVRRARRANPI